MAAKTPRRRKKAGRKPARGFDYGTSCDLCGATANKKKKIEIWSFSKKGKMQTRCKKHLRRP